MQIDIQALNFTLAVHRAVDRARAGRPSNDPFQRGGNGDL